MTYRWRKFRFLLLELQTLLIKPFLPSFHTEITDSSTPSVCFSVLWNKFLSVTSVR